MSEVKHTPGPWHLVNGTQIRSAKHQIAKVWMMRGSEGVANARLIAAAPDLLEALQESLAALEYVVEQAGGPGCEHEGGVVCFCKENTAIGAARAAIAKATGQPA